jgi:hypothetical protein
MVGPVLLDAVTTQNDFSSSVTTPVVYTVHAANGQTGNYSVKVERATGESRAPEARSVNVSGSIFIGQQVTGSYTYYDYNADPENGTTYAWYRADDTNGTNISGIIASTATYTLQAADQGKYLKFVVTPANAAELGDQGVAVSAWSAKIINSGDTITFDNYSFESNVGAPAGWTITRHPDSLTTEFLAVASDSSPTPHHGSNVAYFTYIGTTSANYAGIQSPEFPLVPGAGLVYNAWVTWPNTLAKFTTYFYFYDSAHNLISSVTSGTTADSGGTDPEKNGSVKYAPAMHTSVEWNSGCIPLERKLMRYILMI